MYHDSQWLKAWPKLNLIPHWLLCKTSGLIQTIDMTHKCDRGTNALDFNAQ